MTTRELRERGAPRLARTIELALEGERALKEIEALLSDARADGFRAGITKALEISSEP